MCGMSMKGLRLSLIHISGLTVAKIGEQMKPQAVKSIETRLVLEAVVKAENIQASDDAVEEQIKKMADAYKMEAEQVKNCLLYTSACSSTEATSPLTCAPIWRRWKLIWMIRTS